METPHAVIVPSLASIASPFIAAAVTTAHFWNASSSSYPTYYITPIENVCKMLWKQVVRCSKDVNECKLCTLTCTKFSKVRKVSSAGKAVGMLLLSINVSQNYSILLIITFIGALGTPFESRELFVSTCLSKNKQPLLQSHCFSVLFQSANITTYWFPASISVQMFASQSVYACLFVFEK